MYLGLLLMLGGAATLFGTLPFHAAWIAFYLIVDRVFCRYEEQKLTAAFDGEYADYMARVKRWI
jgi:protein-S-isoprenylcysteine O-methyltransferase Ste14